MTRTTHTGLVLHTLVPVAFFAAATALGLSTLADPAVAEPPHRESGIWGRTTTASSGCRTKMDPAMGF